jgi:hypothetical protein
MEPKTMTIKEDQARYRQKHRKEIRERQRKWRKANPERTRHFRYNDYLKYRLSHPLKVPPPKRDYNNERRPEQWIAHNIAEQLPLAKYCELCPEDDLKPATQRHHPDYNLPSIFISVCAKCHFNIDKRKLAVWVIKQ